MPDYYRKQQAPRPEQEWYKEAQVKKLNSDCLPQLLTELGIGVTRPDDPVPESNGVPRVFLMDEKEGKPRSLEQEGVKTGTVQFWELMRQGRMFAYPAGKTEPVQLQVKGEWPPVMHISAPLSKGTEGFDYREVKKPPEPKKMPQPVPRPGWFSRLMHRINSSLFTAENVAYKEYRQKCDQIRAANEKQKSDYEAEAAKAKQELADGCGAASRLAKEAFGQKRTAEALKMEPLEQEQLTEAYEVREKQRKLEAEAKDAEERENCTEDAVENMISMYGPRPEALPRLLKGKQYKAEHIQSLTPIELPEGMTVGKTPVDDRLFANLALHAQMAPEISRKWYDGKYADGCKRLKQAGLSEEQIDRVVGQSGSGMYVTDTVKQAPRVTFNQFFEIATDPGRKRANEALTKYREGDPKPLAKIIVDAAACTVSNAKHGYSADGSMTQAMLSCELLDLLEQDPALAAAAKEQGLSKNDVKTCRGMDCVRELLDNSRTAQKKLALAAAENYKGEKDPLSEVEKTEYMKDVVKFQTVRTLMSKQASEDNFPEFKKADKLLEERKKATVKAQTSGKPMPDGLAPLDSDLRGELQELCRLEYIKAPDVLRVLRQSKEAAKVMEDAGVEPEQDSLDKLAELTVKGLGYDKMESVELANHIGSNALTGANLILAQENLRKGKQAPQAGEKENALDVAVDYGHGKAGEDIEASIR